MHAISLHPWRNPIMQSLIPTLQTRNWRTGRWFAKAQGILLATGSQEWANRLPLGQHIFILTIALWRRQSNPKEWKDSNARNFRPQLYQWAEFLGQEPFSTTRQHPKAATHGPDWHGGPFSSWQSPGYGDRMREKIRSEGQCQGQNKSGTSKQL